jgi:hypothetical protein
MGGSVQYGEFGKMGTSARGVLAVHVSHPEVPHCRYLPTAHQKKFTDPVVVGAENRHNASGYKPKRECFVVMRVERPSALRSLVQ